MTRKSINHQHIEIFKGVHLEKIIDPKYPGKVFQLNLETKLFITAEISFDFQESPKLEFIDEKPKNTTFSVHPFSKSTLFRFTHPDSSFFKFSYVLKLKLPSSNLQIEALAPYKTEIDIELINNKSWERIRFENMSESEIEQFFERSTKGFIDHSFKPANNSIGLSDMKTNQFFGCIIHWRRLKLLFENKDSSLFSPKKRIFENLSFDPCDVQQGCLNTFQIQSAISTISEHESLIKRIIDFSLLQFGIIKIRLYVRGEWKRFVIDDYFPCYPLGDPIFSKNKSNALWIMSIEKALAKKHGNYSNLVSKSVQNTFVDLTGCPTFRYRFTDQVIINQINNDKFWNTLREWLVVQFLVIVTPKEKIDKSQVPEFSTEKSLQVYRIISVEGNKILNIRNPWEKVEWKGNWSETSPLWTPSILKQVEPEFEKYPNNFWISWESLLSNFDEINVCKVSGWNEMSLTGKFLTLINTNDKSIRRFLSNSYYQLNVQKETNVVFGIHQSEEEDELSEEEEEDEDEDQE